jgi:hypothetical protein
MLGCHDFCGYYEWTFHYARRRWGQTGFTDLLSDSIGGESQGHYSEAAERAGLRGLYETWIKTGEDEHCDWTWTLDEEKNVLRSDMRECPSKGFLNKNDLNADVDYCNHCAGWVVPLLEGVGAEMVEHEHNHCGQCWFTIRMKDRPMKPFTLEGDIRNDPRWNRGYLDRWLNAQPLPLLPELSESSDPCEVLAAWLRRINEPGTASGLSNSTDQHTAAPVAALMTDTDYNAPGRSSGEPQGVLIGCPPADLAATAARYRQTPASQRPLLLHAYLPSVPYVDFVSVGLPRPIPILPLLIQNGQYTHTPGGPHPTTNEFIAMLNNLPR